MEVKASLMMRARCLALLGSLALALGCAGVKEKPGSGTGGTGASTGSGGSGNGAGGSTPPPAACNGVCTDFSSTPVIDGSAIPAGVPDPLDDGTVVHTLLGQLAWRLGGTAAYEQVAAQDRGALGSGTAQLAALLEAHAPCLILLDETLEYLNKALGVAVGDGNLAGTTLTIIKELCTAAANVPGAAVLATLTAVSVACLTIYDMIKAVERGVRIEGIHLIEKKGGKSGHYRARE